MAENKVQFQKGLGWPEFMEIYGSEVKCFDSVFRSRWPDGFECPECGNRAFCRLKRRGILQCNRCRRQTSLTSGTIFHSTNLPLTKWFLAMHLLSQSKNGISALEMSRQVDIGYKTAWRMKHKLMQVMMEQEELRPLKGRVEVDDAYLGGERRGGKRGRGSENKIPFIAAVETDFEGHPRLMKLRVVKGFTKAEAANWREKKSRRRLLRRLRRLALFSGDDGKHARSSQNDSRTGRNKRGQSKF